MTRRFSAADRSSMIVRESSRAWLPGAPWVYAAEDFTALSEGKLAAAFEKSNESRTAQLYSCAAANS